MFAVVGTWGTEGALDASELSHIVDVVRTQAGFRRGYWGQDQSDLGEAHAFVVFDSADAAATMAAGVRSAIPGASLRVIQVLADA